MAHKKYYNPQDDVVQIKDGKRIPVRPYNLYEIMHQEPKRAVYKPAPEGPLSLSFDGQTLKIIHKEGDTIKEYPFAAVSGRAGEDGSFDYSPERQLARNKGPIPEGKHQIDTKSTRYWKDVGWLNKQKSKIGRGPFPGGEDAWGAGRIDVELHPDVAAATGRGGITIHGGKTPGSAGCIDLVDNASDFFSTLEKLKGPQEKIPLTVDYSKTPKKVWWPFGKKKKD